MKRQTMKLQQDLREMKTTEALLRSDINDYKDAERVKRIAAEKYDMVPKAAQPQVNAAPVPSPTPVKADSGKRQRQ